MEFRLVYQGKLPAAARDDPRTKDKHRIRKLLHPQLRQLWQTHPGLTNFRSLSMKSGDNYDRCGYHFVPLVCDELVTSCGIDMLFLRRDGPGSIVKHGGDIDNRLKVLFDALRLPSSRAEVCYEDPGADENPFFVLLQDDALITEFKVTTDRLLIPRRDDEGEHDVHIIMRVETFGIGRTLV